MEGLMELARKKLKLNIEIGRAREIKTDFSELFGPETATLAGILLYENDNELTKKIDQKQQRNFYQELVCGRKLKIGFRSLYLNYFFKHCS